MTPSEHIDELFAQAEATPDAWATQSTENRERIKQVALNLQNRACVRLVMACMLAKIHRPALDPRRPYTKMKGKGGKFSGRNYDEKYVSQVIRVHRLPCNSTTAFLTPALRNLNSPLTRSKRLQGEPRALYSAALELLDEVANDRESAEDVLTDTFRRLLQLREEQQELLTSLKERIRASSGPAPLSSEEIVGLIQRHLAGADSSRLPVLVVAAAYQAVTHLIGEQAKPLSAHTAADEQTGAAGDLEICLTSDEQVRTVYEMKSRAVAISDLDRAIQKLEKLPAVDNYIFVTTEPIAQEAQDYARRLYRETHTEFAILDCVGFIRHFLHLFHRHRAAFLETYQEFVLAEPDSAVSFGTKQAFLGLRQAATDAANAAT